MSSAIEERVERYVRRAEKMLRCGMCAKYLRHEAELEGILEYVQIYARQALRRDE